MSPIRWRSVGPWTVAYLAVGLAVAAQESDVGQAAFYPPVAIGIAFVLLQGRRVWPILLVLELIIATAQYHFDVPAGAVSAVVTVGEILLGSELLRRLGFHRNLDRPEDVVQLGLVAAVIGVVGATIGVALLEVVGHDQAIDEHWRVWAVGEASAVAVLLPAILLWTLDPRERRRRLPRLSHAQRTELAGTVVVAVVALVAFFATRDVRDVRLDDLGLLLLGILPTIWVALRFGSLRTSIFLPVVDAIAVVAFAGVGPHLVHHTPVVTIDLVPIQLAMFAVAVAAMAIAVALEAERNAREREAAVVGASPLAIVAIDPEGITLTWSPAAEAIFGYTAEEAIGRPLPIVPPDGVEAFRERVRRGARGRLDTRVEYRRRDGSPITARLVTAPMYDLQGAHYATVGLIEDITADLEAERRQVLLNTAIDQAAEAIVVTDPTPAIVYANPGATRTSGYSLDELLGANPRIFQSGVHDLSFYERMWDTITAGRTWRGVLVNRRKDGEFYEERSTIAPVHDADGTTIAYVSVKHDLTRERHLEANLAREQRDREAVRAVMARTEAQPTVERTVAMLCTAIADVTGLAGAAVLLLQPDGSLVLVGDRRVPAEYRNLVITPDRGAHEIATRSGEGPWWIDWTRATRLNERYRALSEGTGVTAGAYAPIRWHGRLIGVLTVASDAPDGPVWVSDHLTLVAELGAYAGVLLGSLSEQEGTVETQRAELAALIAEHRYSIVFQPYVDLDTREVRGYEALARFDDGSRPDRRILDAWTIGMGPELEAALGAEALTRSEQLPGDTRISINFSPETVLDGTAAAVVRGHTHPLTIEITEHVEVQDYQALRDALTACDDVQVSVDDAGAGYASLRHILELKPDVVKLDIGLIRGIDTDPARQSLAAGLCRYAGDTGVQLIAEGIETEGEADAVRRLGVHLGQGYLFGRPAPLSGASG